MPEGMPPGLLVYKDPNKLWNGFALPVLKSVLKEPPR
jgi:hypothetical protein